MTGFGSISSASGTVANLASGTAASGTAASGTAVSGTAASGTAASAAASTTFNAPINLQTSGVTFADCTRKCEYVLEYKPTTFQIDVADDNLHYKPVFGSTSMVYNGTTYSVLEMRLYLGSLHAWDGQTADAELQIRHKSLNGSNTLVVCIPILNSDSSNGESVNDIIDPVTNSDPSVEYNISRIIPKAKYFAYTGNGQFNKSFTGITYVLFNKADALFISNNKINDLKFLLSSITPKFTSSQTDPRMDSSAANSIFLSTSPPKTSEGILDDIFIECKPTGDFGVEVIDKPTESILPTFRISPAMQNDIIIKIMKVFVAVFVIMCIFKMFNVFSAKAFNGE
jgi:carbonic anhydrase